ncbi:MAG: replication-associated recombination protein A [Thermodesulfobacteriota bacterium]
MDLFDLKSKKTDTTGKKGFFPGHDDTTTAPPPPLAERMRPRTITEFLGQEHILGEDKFLSSVVRGGELPSMILWGPPGTGKTTLSRILASSAGAEYVELSAVASGVKEIRAVIKEAEDRKARGQKTLLFMDEIHRFNKAQQDAFLHSVEDGTLTLIGATTENPSFELNGPLLSRCRVIVLEALDEGILKKIIRSAIKDRERGLGGIKASVDPGAVDFIVEHAQGDARAALNCLEVSYMIAAKDKAGTRLVTAKAAREALQKKVLHYDKGAEEHYNVISAFIKSMRASDADAALYWLARMVEAGEDPLFIVRRMVIFASEDIGNADPRALSLAISVKAALEFIGMPEGWIPMAQAATYLATAPKSNASYRAYKKAASDAREHGALAVPMHLRNAPTSLMKKLGYSAGYKYPHNYEGAVVDQECLPEELCGKGKKYYEPTERGHEQTIRAMMEKKKDKA